MNKKIEAEFKKWCEQHPDLDELEAATRFASENNIEHARDELMSRLHRERTGEFYTPQRVVNLLYDTVEGLPELQRDFWEAPRGSQIGIYDPAAGTGNLLVPFLPQDENDCAYRVLGTTLLPHDVEMLRKRGVADAFQFDFLNEFDEKAKMVAEHFRNCNNVVIVCNPPYASPANASLDLGDQKPGVSDTKTKSEMQYAGYAARNLYVQFMHNMSKLSDMMPDKKVYFVLIHPANFFTGQTFAKFRKRFSEKHPHVHSYVIKSTEFPGVKGLFGIALSRFYQKDPAPNTAPPFCLFDLDKYRVESVLAARMRDSVKDREEYKLFSEKLREITIGTRIDAPQLQNFNKVCETGGLGKLIQESPLGYMHNNGSSVVHNSGFVGLYSSAFRAGQGIPLTATNYRAALWLFLLRKSVENTGYNSWLEYEYFDPDSVSNSKKSLPIVYAVCSKHSNFSSLRNVKYRGKSVNIYNHFSIVQPSDSLFRGAILEDYKSVAADKNRISNGFNFPQIFNDSFDEYGFYSDVLYDARTHMMEILERSIDIRLDVLERGEHADLHLQAHDIGLRQIRELYKRIQHEEKSFEHLDKAMNEIEAIGREFAYEAAFAYREAWKRTEE